MKRILEKLKAIYHIIMDDEYAVYTVTVKNGIRKRSCCYISDSASPIFLDCIVVTTEDAIKDKSN